MISVTQVIDLQTGNQQGPLAIHLRSRQVMTASTKSTIPLRQCASSSFFVGIYVNRTDSPVSRKRPEAKQLFVLRGYHIHQGNGPPATMSVLKVACQR